MSTQTVPLPQAPPPGADVIGTARVSQGSETTFRGTVSESEFYPCTLVDLKALELPDKYHPGKTRQVCCWLFAIDGRESEGVIARNTSFSLHEKSYFPTVFKGLGKTVPAPGEPIKRSELVGSKCKILFEVKKDGDRTFTNVAKVVPA